MKRTFYVKIAYWSIIGLCILLFMVQNQEYFFKTATTLNYNLISIAALQETKIFAVYNTPEIANWQLFLLSFLAGVALTALFFFFGWFKSKRTIKVLSADCDALHQKVSDLERELKGYRGDAKIEVIEPEPLDKDKSKKPVDTTKKK